MLDDGCISTAEQADQILKNVGTDEEWIAIGDECKDDGGLHSVLALAHPSNAASIVACVNACRGINPEAVPALLALAKTVLFEINGGNATWRATNREYATSGLCADLNKAVASASAALELASTPNSHHTNQ